MKRIILIIIGAMMVLNAETLFEVKDASNNPVLSVSTDGLRVMNEDDTLMVISSEEIRANIGMTNKGLSRAFSVTTTQSKGKGLINALEVDASSATMTSPDGRYTDFSPLNLFLGLNAGQSTVPTSLPFSAGDPSTWEGKFNIFIGNQSGMDNITGCYNLFVGDKSGQNNTSGDKNTFVGSQSGQANSVGGYNSFFGYNSGITTTGSYNTFTGANVGFNNSSGNYNTYMGTAAGEYFRGSGNTFIGNQAGRNSYSIQNGDGNVFIGNMVGSASGSVSNMLYIDNSSTNTPLIYGDFSTDTAKIFGNFFTSGNMTMEGTSFKINENPGTGTVPTNYVWQGGSAGSISKEYAFAINDALWVYTHAWIDGNLTVAGTTYKSADEIKIDHPLDPVNKSLYHSGVISDERMSVYSGNAILDKEGKASVVLPDWFQALNEEYRYQLTPIGGSAPELYIAQEIENGIFMIAGGPEKLKVSWMITAVRKDKYSKENPFKTEKFKSEETTYSSEN